MDLFGRKRAAHERHILEKRLAELEAKALCGTMVALVLLKTAPPKQRASIEKAIQGHIANGIKNRRPAHVPIDYHQTYRDALSGALQKLLAIKGPGDK